ncbi:MAG TPA: RluA family pseudouridine synthase [bacterium]|nr:RluA family pseudouridine synthase [bacterium]
MTRERHLTLTAQAEMRAATLVREATGLAHSAVRGLFDHGCVLRGDVPCEDPGLLLAAGERLELRYDPARRYRGKPKARSSAAFRLVHEDPYLLVVDKAPGVLTVPNHGETDTLVDAVRHHLGRGRKQAPRVFVVHRLDRETSGLLVIARTPDVAHALKAQFAAHKPERVYQALVAGTVREDAGTFRSRLATDPSLNQRSTTHPDAGKLAITHYRVTARVPGATAVEVRLETGRRNQIRVHFAEAGHPVLGDPRYEPERARHPRWKTRRMALHAAVLGLTHPVTGRTLRFESPTPPEMSAFQAGEPSGEPPARRKASPKAR